MDLGGELRAARNARSLSLDDVSSATKISRSLLQSIESNAFADTPGGLFTRGYLRAYARVVGLDPEAIVRRYRELEAPEPEPAATAEQPTSIDIAEQEAASRHSQIVQFVVVMVVALGYLASQRGTKPAAGPEPHAALAEAAAPAAPAPADAAPVGTSGSMSAPNVPLAIELHPTGPCWVDVTVDGEHTVAKLLNAGDHERVAMRENLTLRVGDPAAFGFTVDGVAGRSLGVAGHPVTVKLNRANYRTWLGRSPGA
jgi:cytoskeleton protein RodZ